MSTWICHTDCIYYNVWCGIFNILFSPPVPWAETVNCLTNKLLYHTVLLGRLQHSIRDIWVHFLFVTLATHTALSLGVSPYQNAHKSTAWTRSRHEKNILPKINHPQSCFFFLYNLKEQRSSKNNLYRDVKEEMQRMFLHSQACIHSATISKR